MIHPNNRIIWLFGYLGHPNNRLFRSPDTRITKYSQIFGYSIRVTQITKFGDLVFFGFIPIIWKIGERRSKLNSVNQRPCQSVC
jgi:hypothetical protein